MYFDPAVIQLSSLSISVHELSSNFSPEEEYLLVITPFLCRTLSLACQCTP